MSVLGPAPRPARDGRVQIPTAWVILAREILDEHAPTASVVESARLLAEMVVDASEFPVSNRGRALAAHAAVMPLPPACRPGRPSLPPRARTTSLDGSAA